MPADSAMAVAGAFVSVAPATPASAEAAAVGVKKKNGKMTSQARNRVVKVARINVGKRYVYGGSGLVHYTYKWTTGKTFPRTAAGQNYGTHNAKRSNVKRGDLVFFNGMARRWLGPARA